MTSDDEQERQVMEALCAPYDREFVQEEDLASNFALKHKDEDLRFRMEFEVGF